MQHTGNRYPTDLSGLMQRLNASLAEQLDCFEPEIRPMARDALDSGGKRFRSALVFYSGWRGDAASVSDELIRAATVIEIVHLATLLHDDVLDGGTLRRGDPTAHVRLGTKAAVLLGDALFAQALYLAATFPDNRVCREVAATARRVCSGEIIQSLGGDNGTMDRVRYRRVIDLKTAALYTASCSLGAGLAGYPLACVQSAARFGRHLGIAYQMADDLLDIFGTETATGKTLGSDFRDGKATLPLIVLHECLDVQERDALLRDFGRGDAAALDHWRDRMIRLGVKDQSEAELAAELAKAEAALSSLPGDAAPRLMLRELLEQTRANARSALAG